MVVRHSSVLSGRVVSLKDEAESITMEEIKQGLDVAYYPVRQTTQHTRTRTRTRRHHPLQTLQTRGNTLLADGDQRQAQDSDTGRRSNASRRVTRSLALSACVCVCMCFVRVVSCVHVC